MPKTTVIMLAPIGARLTQADHPALPMSIAETVKSAAEATAVGAQAVHAHVRTESGGHTLDTGLYQELLDTAAQALGKYYPVQITTESVGHYTKAEQMAVVKTLTPRFCSIALRELLPPDHHAEDSQTARDFYHWALEHRVGIQHILYGIEDMHFYLAQRESGVIPKPQDAVLAVLGRYEKAQLANIDDVEPIAQLANQNDLKWMLCAFGQTETPCLVKAATLGGGVRIGFENSRQHSNGDIAKDNTARVQELMAELEKHEIGLAEPDDVLAHLGAI